MDQGQSKVGPLVQELFVLAFITPGHFELARRPVAETGMEALVVVDIVQEALQVSLGFGESLIVVRVLAYCTPWSE